MTRAIIITCVVASLGVLTGWTSRHAYLEDLEASMDALQSPDQDAIAPALHQKPAENVADQAKQARDQLALATEKKRRIQAEIASLRPRAERFMDRFADELSVATSVPEMDLRFVRKRWIESGSRKEMDVRLRIENRSEDLSIRSALFYVDIYSADLNKPLFLSTPWIMTSLRGIEPGQAVVKRIEPVGDDPFKSKRIQALDQHDVHLVIRPREIWDGHQRITISNDRPDRTITDLTAQLEELDQVIADSQRRLQTLTGAGEAQVAQASPNGSP